MRSASWWTVGVVLALVPAALTAQQTNIRTTIRDNQLRLDSIRKERDALADQLRSLSSQVRSITDELQNIERQKRVTARLVNELDRQLGEMNAQVDTVTMELLLAEDGLAETQAILQRRLVEIYKRGPLYTFQVLLTAESFGQLVSRYKYLYLASRQDRALVTEVSDLRNRVAIQRRRVVDIQAAVNSRVSDRSRELEQYFALERRRQASLRNAQQRQRFTETRLDSLARREAQLVEVLAALERARRAAVASGDARAAGATITSANLGGLEWPVEGGSILYPFGAAPGPDRTTILNQGIGIKVPVGTDVKSVAAGQVSVAGPMETYGLSVILDHGGGIYTLYHHLSFITVRQGQWVVDGEVLGQSGGATSGRGPHIEFQIRQVDGAGNPIALDPENWLKSRRRR